MKIFSKESIPRFGTLRVRKAIWSFFKSSSLEIIFFSTFPVLPFAHLKLYSYTVLLIYLERYLNTFLFEISSYIMLKK